MRASWKVVVAICLSCATATAKKAPPTPCPDGLFAVERAPFAIDGASSDSVRIGLVAGQVSLLEVCPDTVAVRVKAGVKATKLAAAFPTCAGRFATAKLKAAIRAPACTDMRGVLIVKGAKPKRRPFTAKRLTPAGLIADLRTDAAQERMANENFPSIMRPAAEALNPEVRQLIAEGSAAVDGILAQFAGTATLPDDVPLALLAYVLERIGDPRAVPVLADWLERNLFATVLFADEFVTHTIKVLGQHGGLQADFTYDIEEKLDTIARVRSTPAPAALLATARAVRPAAGVPESRNKCEKIISVVGINAEGQQEIVKISYKTVFYDLDQQIDLETDPTKLQALKNTRDRYRRDDDAAYGSSDYRPIGDVGVQSNCGGSVTERLLNEVAAQRGIPIRLGAGNTGADDIRNLARKFGGPVGGSEIDTLTVIAHEREAGDSAHVEIPQSVNGDSAVVYSKDNQGRPRLHTVSRGSIVNFFGAVQERYNFRPFANAAQTTPRFYRIDPSRILGITLDSSACPCDFAYGGVVAVAITQPVAAEVADRVVSVGGTIGDSTVTDGMLRVNGSPQGLSLSAGGFSSEVVLRSGDNVIRVAVDAPDGRRGCAERTIRSTTPKTTLSATLTWDLAGADVDLYATQPDGETAYYSARTTTIGGRLDVDNTSGHGPENYFLSFAEGDTVLPGAYVIRVHYYSDHDADPEHPARPVTWRVVVLVNEGTPAERREILGGTLSTPAAGNSSPGGSGADWATATTVTLAE